MKTRTAIFSAVLLISSNLAYAGVSSDVPVEIDLENRSAIGNMKTARYSENENARIGCGTRSIDLMDGNTFRWGFCQAANDDVTENAVFCSTENATLLAEIDSLSDNAFITFRWDEGGVCTAVGNSTQSSYLASNKDEDKKVKKDNKDN